MLAVLAASIATVSSEITLVASGCTAWAGSQKGEFLYCASDVVTANGSSVAPVFADCTTCGSVETPSAVRFVDDPTTVTKDRGAKWVFDTRSCVDGSAINVDDGLLGRYCLRFRAIPWTVMDSGLYRHWKEHDTVLHTALLSGPLSVAGDANAVPDCSATWTVNVAPSTTSTATTPWTLVACTVADVNSGNWLVSPLEAGLTSLLVYLYTMTLIIGILGLTLHANTVVGKGFVV